VVNISAAWAPDSSAYARFCDYGLTMGSLAGGKFKTTLSLEAAVSSLAWAPDARHLALGIGEDGNEVRVIDLKGKAVHSLRKVNEADLLYAPTGHYRLKKGEANPYVYVIQTEKGRETLTPAEFEKRFGWKNDPKKVFVPGE
jgi:uncharacterized protein with WD repeat